MQEVQILGVQCKLESTAHNLRIVIDSAEGNSLVSAAHRVSQPSSRLITEAWFHAMKSSGEIHLKSTFFCNGGMINIPWEEWSLDRLIAWLESYFQEGIQGLPDWCSK